VVDHFNRIFESGRTNFEAIEKVTSSHPPYLFDLVVEATRFGSLEFCKMTTNLARVQFLFVEMTLS
jgi:hypothetical protein